MPRLTDSKTTIMLSIQLKNLSMRMRSRPGAREASLLKKCRWSIRPCLCRIIKRRIAKLAWSRSRCQWRDSTQDKRIKSRAIINRIRSDKRKQIWRKSNNHRRVLCDLLTKNQSNQQNRTSRYKRSNKEERKYQDMQVLKAWRRPQ
jgi:hypothetical protein